MSMKDKYLEAMQRADAKDAARAAKKDRKAQQDALRAQANIQSHVQLLQAMDQTSAASSAPVEPQRSAVKAAQVECLCHKGLGRKREAHGLCRQNYDATRYTNRMAADTDEDATEAVQRIIDSGVIPRAKTKMQLAAERAERGTATALKEVANANNKPVVLTPKPDLPDGVNFFDPNQARYLGKCILMRGMNFAAGVSDAYPKLSPYDAGVVANAAERDPNVRAAIEQEASQRGLGDSDKQIFVGLLWKHATSLRPQDYQDRGTAMRILSKVFIEQQAQQQQPVSLHIEGISEGLARMGLTPDVLATVPAMVSAEMPDLKDEDFEKEDSND